MREQSQPGSGREQRQRACAEYWSGQAGGAPCGGAPPGRGATLSVQRIEQGEPDRAPVPELAGHAVVYGGWALGGRWLDAYDAEEIVDRGWPASHRVVLRAGRLHPRAGLALRSAALGGG